jgi:hypothetical protein
MLVKVERFLYNADSAGRGWDRTDQLVNTKEIESAYRDWNPPNGLSAQTAPVTKVRTCSGDEFWIVGDIDQLIGTAIPE